MGALQSTVPELVAPDAPVALVVAVLLPLAAPPVGKLPLAVLPPVGNEKAPPVDGLPIEPLPPVAIPPVAVVFPPDALAPPFSPEVVELAPPDLVSLVAAELPPMPFELVCAELVPPDADTALSVERVPPLGVELLELAGLVAPPMPWP